MKNIDQIIEDYSKDWHIVDGLYIKEVQSITDEEKLAILENAKGRDIIIDENESLLDGEWYKYDWSEDPNFDLAKYL